MGALAHAYAHAKPLTRKEKREFKAKPKAEKPQISSEMVNLARERDRHLAELAALPTYRETYDAGKPHLVRDPRPGFKPKPVLSTSKLCLPGQPRLTPARFALTAKSIDKAKLAELPQTLINEGYTPDPQPQRPATLNTRKALQDYEKACGAIIAAADAERLIKEMT